MAQYESFQALEAEGDPGFLVDVVARRFGRLVSVSSQLCWDGALDAARDAFTKGCEVEVEESGDFEDGTPLPGEFDRQD